MVGRSPIRICLNVLTYALPSAAAATTVSGAIPACLPTRLPSGHLRAPHTQGCSSFLAEKPKKPPVVGTTGAPVVHWCLFFTQCSKATQFSKVTMLKFIAYVLNLNAVFPYYTNSDGT